MSRHQILLSLFSLTIGMIACSCQNAAKIEQDKYLSNGRDLYIKHCQNCHGSSAEGLGELAPPLTDTLYLKKNKNKLACIIKNGLNEPVIIHGKSYEGKMPDFSTLADIDIAQLIVYITNSAGSSQGMYKTELVTRDLQHCK